MVSLFLERMLLGAEVLLMHADVHSSAQHIFAEV